MSNIAMIPARMGSQSLPQKSMAALAGAPLITHAIRKCLVADLFDEVWVNSEHPALGEIAEAEGASFHQRPEHLGSRNATSEEFVAEFLEKHDCDVLYQVHYFAPLLSAEDMAAFVAEMSSGAHDVLMSATEERLEYTFNDAPVNFTFREKAKSWDLRPVRRIVWAITAWRRDTFLAAIEKGDCATYAGRVGYFPLGRLAGHVVKTQEDLDIAEALFPLTQRDGRQASKPSGGRRASNQAAA